MASTCHHDIRYVLITGVYLFFPSLSTIFLRPGPKVLLLSSNYQYNISLVHPRAVSALKPIINGVNFPLVQETKETKESASGGTLRLVRDSHYIPMALCGSHILPRCGNSRNTSAQGGGEGVVCGSPWVALALASMMSLVYPPAFLNFLCSYTVSRPSPNCAAGGQLTWSLGHTQPLAAMPNNLNPSGTSSTFGRCTSRVLWGSARILHTVTFITLFHFNGGAFPYPR